MKINVYCVQMLLMPDRILMINFWTNFQAGIIKKKKPFSAFCVEHLISFVPAFLTLSVLKDNQLRKSVNKLLMKRDKEHRLKSVFLWLQKVIINLLSNDLMYYFHSVWFITDGLFRLKNKSFSLLYSLLLLEADVFWLLFSFPAFLDPLSQKAP